MEPEIKSWEVFIKGIKSGIATSATEQLLLLQVLFILHY